MNLRDDLSRFQPVGLLTVSGEEPFQGDHMFALPIFHGHRRLEHHEGRGHVARIGSPARRAAGDGVANLSPKLMAWLEPLPRCWGSVVIETEAILAKVPAEGTHCLELRCAHFEGRLSQEGVSFSDDRAER